MELVLLMYNAHPYFSLKNLGKKKCTLYRAKYSIGWNYSADQGDSLHTYAHTLLKQLACPSPLLCRRDDHQFHPNRSP